MAKRPKPAVESSSPAKPEPTLITEAEPSLIEQQRARVRKYSIMMSFRVPLFLLATWVYTQFHSGLAAVAILAVSIPLPWMAVLIANDRPPLRRRRASTLPPTGLVPPGPGAAHRDDEKPVLEL